MESGAKYLFVGISILLLAFTTVGALLWLAKAGQFERSAKYTIFFEESSLSGLEVGSAVTFRGLRVGAVTGINFSQTDIERIGVEIEIEEDTPVKVDTEAVITRNLLTGVAIIDLVKGTQEALSLKDAPVTVERRRTHYPVIKEGQGQFEKLKQTLPEAVEELSASVRQIGGFLSEENRVAVTNTIKNIESITKDLSDSQTKPSQLLTEVHTLTKELQLTAKEVRTVAKQSGESIVAASATVVHQSRILTERVTQATREVASVAAKFKRPREILSGPAEWALGPGEEVQR